MTSASSHRASAWPRRTNSRRVRMALVSSSRPCSASPTCSSLDVQVRRSREHTAARRCRPRASFAELSGSDAWTRSMNSSIRVRASNSHVPAVGSVWALASNSLHRRSVSSLRNEVSDSSECIRHRFDRDPVAAYGVRSLTVSAAGQMSEMRVTFAPADSGPESTRLTGPSSRAIGGLRKGSAGR